jgi:phage shock protein PspC (stress-responsive transcriptional regulator)
MNKIITINLGGIALQIEEDAYDVLRNYIHKLESHFKSAQNGGEIIDDIEARMAEMLFEKLKKGKLSINREDINEVIKIMGEPSDFDKEDTSETLQNNAGRRRLYRDADSKVIGGVCSGLSKYLGIDVVVVRIIWLILFFIFGSGLLLYIILWVIIPKAVTASEKLEMMGEMPNIDNIRRTVSEEAGKAVYSIREHVRSAKVREGLNEAASLISRVFRAVFSFVAGIISLVFLAIIVVVVMYLLFGQGTIGFGDDAFSINDIPRIYQNQSLFWTARVLLNLLLILPALALVLRLAEFIFNVRTRNKPVYQILGGFWLLVFLACTAITIYTVRGFQADARSFEEIPLIIASDTLKIGVMDGISSESSGFINGMVKVHIEPALGKSAELRIRKFSRGTNTEEALDRAKKLKSEFSLINNQLNISEFLHLGSDVYRAQKIIYDLRIPVGTVIRINPNLERIMSESDNDQNFYRTELAGHTYIMTITGLSCLDCSASGEETGYKKLESFNMVKVNDAFTVHIRKAGIHGIKVEGTDEFIEHTRYDCQDGELKIWFDNDWGKLKNWVSGDENYISINMPDLRRLEINGASHLTIENMNLDILDAELNGASHLELNDLTAQTMKFELKGGSKVEASGETENLNIESNGAGSFDAFELLSQRAKLDLSGASKCNLNVAEYIRGKIRGAASLQYKGDARIETESNGLVSIEKVD